MGFTCCASFANQLQIYTDQHSSVNTRTFPTVLTLTATDLPVRSLTISHRQNLGAKRGSGYNTRPNTAILAPWQILATIQRFVVFALLRER